MSIDSSESLPDSSSSSLSSSSSSSSASLFSSTSSSDSSSSLSYFYSGLSLGGVPSSSNSDPSIGVLSYEVLPPGVAFCLMDDLIDDFFKDP